MGLDNGEMRMEKFKRYSRRGFVEARPYVSGEDLTGISVSTEDQRQGFDGGFIARNPNNHDDQWFISADYFKKNYDEDPR